MRTRTVFNLLIAFTLVLALAAPAAAQAKGAPASANDQPLIGFGVSFLHDEGETAKGFVVDFAKQIRPMDKAAISAVGDVGFYHFDGGNAFSFLGGVRVTGTSPAKFHPFGQFMVGGARFSASDCTGDGCSESAFTISFGGGVDVHLNDKWNFRAQIDFPIVMFEGDSATTQRFTFGLSTRLGS